MKGLKKKQEAIPVENQAPPGRICPSCHDGILRADANGVLYCQSCEYTEGELTVEGINKEEVVEELLPETQGAIDKALDEELAGQAPGPEEKKGE